MTKDSRPDKTAVLNSSSLGFDNSLQLLLGIKYKPDRLNFYQSSQSVMSPPFIRWYIVKKVLLFSAHWVQVVLLHSAAHFILCIIYSDRGDGDKSVTIGIFHLFSCGHTVFDFAVVCRLSNTCYRAEWRSWALHHRGWHHIYLTLCVLISCRRMPWTPRSPLRRCSVTLSVSSPKTRVSTRWTLKKHQWWVTEMTVWHFTT